MSEANLQSPGRAYSQRLGLLTPRQFQAALMRFGLGDFIDATPVPQGLFGQNVFVTSTQGAYVLRGAPHYPCNSQKSATVPPCSTSRRRFLSHIPIYLT